MAFKTEKTSTGEDIVINGFEQGIANSPHKGIANIQGGNIATETNEILAAYNRVLQFQSNSLSGTLTPLTHSTVSFGVTNVPIGSWIHIVTDSGTGLSGDYYYGGSNQIFTIFGGTAVNNITLNSTPVTVFLTAGTTSWTVPANFDSTLANSFETIGAGGGGGYGPIGGAVGSPGAGGGAYSKVVNQTLTPGAVLQVQIGAAGVGGTVGTPNGTGGGDTWFNGTNVATSLVGAKGGAGTNSGNGSGGLGGASASGIGTTKASGGNGGSTSSAAGAGGGGAAGPNGAGNNGTNSSGSATAGGSGDAGFGGAGGAATGQNGGNGTEYDGTHGSGGGGGSNNSAAVGNGGNYGGAGAGGEGNAINGGNGAPGLIRIVYFSTAVTTSATFTVYSMGQPIQDATEPYTDSSGNQQYRYYILDKLGQLWVHDTSMTTPQWFMPEAPVAIGGRTASGLAVLNGWVFTSLDTLFSASPTVLLGQAGGTPNVVNASTNLFHSTLVGKQGKMYYTDGNFINQIFPNTSLLTLSSNIQSYCQYTAVTTTGTVTTLIGGSYPNSAAVPVRIPVWFLTSGTLPSAVSAGQVYYIKWLNVGTTFEVYANLSGGSALDMATGGVGNQYFNTFYPRSSNGLTAVTVTSQRLNLPFAEISQSLVEIGNSVLVGCKGNTIYLWNQISATPQDFINLPENNVAKMISVNNTGYVFAGQKGNIYLTNGSSVSAVISVPDYCAGVPGTPNSYIEPYFTWGGAMYMRGRVWFSILDQTATKAGNCGGIWSFIPTNNFYQGQDTGLALRLENQSSYGTYNGVSTVLLPSQVQTAIGPQYWTGWYSSITSPSYGIDFSDTIPVSQVIIETDLIPTGTLLNKQTFQQFEYKLATPLAAGDSVAFNYRQNATDAWQSITGIIEESTTELSGYYTADFQIGQWLQIQIILNCQANTSSSFCRLLEIRIR